MDKNKSVPTLKGMGPIYYINLDANQNADSTWKTCLHTGRSQTMKESLPMMVEMMI